jgi:hypothetical protein
MTTIGSSFSSSSAWQDLQDWQAKMKAATEQFQNDTSQYTDTLLSAQVTQTQNLTTIIEQGAASRAAKLVASSRLTGGNVVNGKGDVYWGDSGSSSDHAPPVAAPVGGTNSAVYWGVDSTSPVATASPATPSMGTSSSVYWGTPNTDLTVYPTVDVTA